MLELSLVTLKPAFDSEGGRLVDVDCPPFTTGAGPLAEDLVDTVELVLGGLEGLLLEVTLFEALSGLEAALLPTKNAHGSRLV